MVCLELKKKKKNAAGFLNGAARARHLKYQKYLNKHNFKLISLTPKLSIISIAKPTSL